tara:strand:+ start:243 stop:437 length:195 start_codon:yes stop_codon:yes gene_type:complete
MTHYDVTVYRKNVFGNECLYPVSDMAQFMADIAGTKTLTLSMILKAKEAGLTVREVFDPDAKSF